MARNGEGSIEKYGLTQGSEVVGLGTVPRRSLRGFRKISAKSRDGSRRRKQPSTHGCRVSSGEWVGICTFCKLWQDEVEHKTRCSSSHAVRVEVIVRTRQRAHFHVLRLRCCRPPMRRSYEAPASARIYGEVDRLSRIDCNLFRKEIQ